MQAEFPLQLTGRICLTNVSKVGINESIRYVVLIVLKLITSATASGSLCSDGALLLQSDRSTHLAAVGLQEAAGEAQGHWPWHSSLLKLLYQMHQWKMLRCGLKWWLQQMWNSTGQRGTAIPQTNSWCWERDFSLFWHPALHQF